MPPTSTPQTEEITSAEQSFGSLSETSSIDSSSSSPSQSEVSFTSYESLTADGAKVVLETLEDSSQFQLEQSTSLTESPAKTEVIISVEDKPQDLPSDLTLQSRSISKGAPSPATGGR